MSYISIYTVGRLRHPYDHPASREFYDVGNQVFRQARRAGMVDAFPSDGIPIPEEAKGGEGFPILTLTVWRNLESLYRFTYSGHHSQALRDRGKWMETYPEKHLSYVLWWAENLGDVSWEEAFKRYSYYTKNGSTPLAFDFKRAFNEKGEAYSVK